MLLCDIRCTIEKEANKTRPIRKRKICFTACLFERREIYMNEHFLKNIEFSQVLTLAELVAYQPGQVVSRTLVQNKAVGLTIFAFDKGEEISSHASQGDAMVTILEGSARISVGDEVYVLSDGQTIVMPAGVPHAVAAESKFKMFLTVVFPL